MDLLVGRAPEGVPVLVERTTTTISISWGASTDALATGYQLRIRPEGGTSILFNLGQAITTYIFMNLESGTNYIISLQIVGLSEAPQELPVTTCKFFIAFGCGLEGGGGNSDLVRVGMCGWSLPYPFLRAIWGEKDTCHSIFG